ncbi:nucleotidyltransferase family protein [Archangium lipolyticum]|uniref:nucleotidyltransferase family protein n=1 Tax=Archangium lipolyticum TaxID=2970465 RepID=UPI00214A829E|nr:nucleotidyltransferase family protein [Archangium lipolyticum]
MATTGLVLLAAGGSTRLGHSKQLLRWNGRSLLRRAAETALASGCHPVVVVLGAEADAHRAELAGLSVRDVENTRWREGMGGSLRLGMEALRETPSLEAVVLMVCDQPAVTAEHLMALRRTHQERGQPIVASGYAGTVGVPALFDRSLFAELEALPASAGARPLLAKDPGRVAVVPLPGGELDVDTPEDVERLLRT